MNNRLCPLRPVPLCLPLLLREFQIISGQHVSFGVLLESLSQSRRLIHHVTLVLHISYIIIEDIVYFLLLSAVIFGFDIYCMLLSVLNCFCSVSPGCVFIKGRLGSLFFLLSSKLELIQGFPRCDES